jgi:hypothetical protein
MTRLTLPKRGEEGEDRRYTLIPEGSYRVRIWTAMEKLSAKQNPMVEVQYQVEEPGFEKRKLYDHFSLLDTALWKLSDLFEVLGMQHEGDVDINWQDDLVGKRLIVIVEHEKRKSGPRTGELREKIAGYRSVEDQDVDTDLGAPATGLEDEDEVPF